MVEFKESKFYKLLQDFFINNNKETFLQMLAEFYNRTEGIIEKNVNQDELIQELRKLYIEFNEKGIDENIVIEKVNHFVENNVKIKDILAKLVINTNKIEDNTEKLNENTNKIEDNTEKLNINTNNITNINSQLDNTVSYKKMKLDVLNDDNSTIFNNICEEMKNNIELNGIGSNNIISIQSGVYRFNSSITLPSYVKLKPIGTVVFEFTGNGNFITISPEDDLGFNKQMYFRGSLIDGINGGLIIRSINKTNTIGITIGDINSDNQMCRYNLNDVAIHGFHKGLVIKMKHNYICEYSRLHLEKNTINVSIGDGEECINSGENINFKNCVFAGAEKSIYFNNDSNSYVGVYFNNCSFDFNDTVLEISSAYKYSGEVNFCDCHIEQNKCIVNNLGNETFQYYVPIGIKFRNCVIIDGFYVYFKGNKMYIDIDTLRIQTSARVTDIKNSFVASDFNKIIVTARNIKFSNNSNSIGTFFNNSIYPYSTFTEGDLIYQTLKGYGDNTQGNVTMAKVENGVLKFVGNGTGSWIMFNSTIPLNVNYGDTIVLGLKWKTSDAKVNLKVNFLCYDEDDNLIETYNTGDYQWNGTNGEILIHPAKYIFTINNNKIRKFKFKFAFSNFTAFEISDVICNIV